MTEIVENVGQEPEVIKSTEQRVEEFAQKEEIPESVDYAQFRKLLDEKKREQGKRRDLESKFNALQKEQDSLKVQKLEEKQEYKRLYEQTQEELKGERDKRFESEKAIIRSAKMDALNKELGGLQNDRYFQFANFEDIIIEEDGTVNKDSIRYAASNFRTNYPELLKAGKIQSIESIAPTNERLNINNQKHVDNMSRSERSEQKRKFLMK